MTFLFHLILFVLLIAIVVAAFNSSFRKWLLARVGIKSTTTVDDILAGVHDKIVELEEHIGLKKTEADDHNATVKDALQKAAAATAEADKAATVASNLKTLVGSPTT